MRRKLSSREQADDARERTSIITYAYTCARMQAQETNAEISNLAIKILIHETKCILDSIRRIPVLALVLAWGRGRGRVPWEGVAGRATCGTRARVCVFVCFSVRVCVYTHSFTCRSLLAETFGEQNFKFRSQSS
jgi:hypothetical protein